MKERHDIRNASATQPDESHQPPLRCVAAQAPPSEYKVEVEARPGDEGCEEHQDQRGCIVDALKRGDLGKDAQGREFGDGARPWRSPPSGHFSPSSPILFYI